MKYISETLSNQLINHQLALNAVFSFKSANTEKLVG